MDKFTMSNVDDITKLVVAVGAIVGPILTFFMWMRLHPLAAKVQKIEDHTNGMQGQLLTLTEEKGLARGRLQESAAAAVGETSVGTPLNIVPPLLVSEDTKKAIIAKFLEGGGKNP